MRKAYKEYKATGIQWLPQIPRHWDYKKINSLFLERKTKVSDKDYQPLSVTKSGILHQLTDAAKSSDSDNRKLVMAGDFVINSRSDRKGSCGVSALDGSVSLINIVLEPKRKLEQLFVHYLLRCQPFSEEYYRYGRGIVADLWTTRYSEMKSIFLPVPPREEQEQIVRFLDWKVSSINKLISIKQQEIFELKQSFSSFLTKELTGLSNTTNIPLKRVFSVPMTDGPHETPKLEETGIPFVSAESAHDGRINLKDCRGYISVEQHKAFCKKVKPQRDDIFIVKSGSTTGKTVIVDFDEEFSIWSPLALIRCNDLAIPKYIFYFCTSELFQKQVRDKWSFGTQPNIGMNVLRNLRVLLPSIADQNSFVLATDKYWKTVQDLIKLIEQQITNLNDLKSSLIADAVTGQIDVRDVTIPNCETVQEHTDETPDAIANSLETDKEV